MEQALADPESEAGEAIAADDDVLLQRFIYDRDGDAFGELVRRHAGLVLGVCRRTLGHEHEAEEAFQATFLVLATKAGRVAAGSLGPWLYGVAYRIAVRAAEKRARRREAELPDDFLMAADDSLEQVAECHWRRVLDDEINLLPEKYRGAVVLHYLLGKTNKEVAVELGLSERTVEGRQRRGKELLKRRLMLRKVSLPLALAAIAAMPAGSLAAEPLIATTIDASLSFVHGNSAACTADAVRLAQSEVLAMTSSIAPISVTMVMVAALGGAVALAGGHGSVEGSGAVALASMVVADTAAAAAESGSLAAASFVATEEGAAEAEESSAEGSGSSAVGNTDLYQRSEQELKVFSSLNTPLKEPLDFVEQPLSDVVAILEEVYGVQIMIDTPALEAQGLVRDVPTTAKVHDVSLRSALRILLREASPGLDFMVRDEVLLITTREETERSLETHVYDISHYGNDPTAGEQLRAVLLSTVQPESWQEAGTGNGSAMVLGSASLVVSQTQAVHEEIHQFFEQLRRGIERNDGGGRR